MIVHGHKIEWSQQRSLSQHTLSEGATPSCHACNQGQLLFVHEHFTHVFCHRVQLQLYMHATAADGLSVQERFTDALLRDKAQVNLPMDRIFSQTVSGAPKSEVLQMLAQRHPSADYHFVEDKLSTLEKVPPFHTLLKPDAETKIIQMQFNVQHPLSDMSSVRDTGTLAAGVCD